MNNNNLLFSPKFKFDDEHLMSLEDVAEKLGVSSRSVRRLIARGDLAKPVKVLSSPRLYNSDVTTYLERLKQKRDNKEKKI